MCPAHQRQTPGKPARRQEAPGPAVLIVFGAGALFFCHLVSGYPVSLAARGAVVNLVSDYNSSLRSNCALIATITVLTYMMIAPT
ncbi:MAG: hypothetical protein ACOCPQ_02795, partial [Desulfosudaceae bacterium]